jgi:hypothetical protein
MTRDIIDAGDVPRRVRSLPARLVFPRRASLG